MVPNLVIAVQVIVGLILLVGAVTLVIPVLPGLVVIWAAALLYGLVTGFTLPGTILFIIITLIMLVGSIIDYLVVGVSVRQTGTSWLAMGLAQLKMGSCWDSTGFSKSGTFQFGSSSVPSMGSPTWLTCCG